MIQTFAEEDLLPLSALQHYIFCPRQCALIHVEQLWAENLFTAQGRVMHNKVHDEGSMIRDGVKTIRSLHIRSYRLGLVGVADVVEFHQEYGRYTRPSPVEYKRGKAKHDNCDKVQLCAQAICLEEMLDCSIEAGALFYGRTRRRIDVPFDTGLREETAQTATALHSLIDAGKTPQAVYEKKCDTCSLLELCLPKACTGRKAVARYIESGLDAL